MARYSATRTTLLYNHLNETVEQVVWVVQLKEAWTGDAQGDL